jgi:uncharacterized protein (TIGR03435 family)
MTRTLAGICLAILLAGLLPGQSSDKTAFEVADVHVSPPGTKAGEPGFMPGGRLEVRGATMVELIAAAYRVDEKMVMGGPAWLNSDHFDVIAKAPAGVVSEEAICAMLQKLLADRFKLVAHEDKKDLPVYVLTVAKKAPKLTKAAKPGPAETSPGPGEKGINHILCTSCTMQDLAEMLPDLAQNFFDHPVVDETQLKGAYDFQLDWMGINVYRRAKANPDGPPAISAFDAVEKLGLKADPGTRPMPVLIVDSVNETPTPNPAGVTAKIPTFPTEFDVAQVRPAKPGAAEAAMAGRGGAGAQLGPMGVSNFENGRLEILGATLRGLVSTAYNMDDRWIVQAPKWMDEDRFDVIAKTAPTVPFEAIRIMLRNALEPAFELKTHTEDQPMPVYVLAAGKKPLLKEADGKDRSECNIVNTDKRYFVCHNTTMAEFAERLPTRAAAYVHPPILDLTGLKGAYDFQLFWTPKAQLATGGAATGDAAMPTGDVTLYEAVDKQLGLKLEEQKHPIPVLVIDHALQTPIDK